MNNFWGLVGLLAFYIGIGGGAIWFLQSPRRPEPIFSKEEKEVIIHNSWLVVIFIIMIMVAFVIGYGIVSLGPKKKD